MDFKLLVTTKMLMEVLSAGKSSAEFVGKRRRRKSGWVPEFFGICRRFRDISKKMLVKVGG